MCCSGFVFGGHAKLVKAHDLSVNLWRSLSVHQIGFFYVLTEPTNQQWRGAKILDFVKYQFLDRHIPGTEYWYHFFCGFVVVTMYETYDSLLEPHMDNNMIQCSVSHSSDHQNQS